MAHGRPTATPCRVSFVRHGPFVCGGWVWWRLVLSGMVVKGNANREVPSLAITPTSVASHIAARRNFC